MKTRLRPVNTLPVSILYFVIKRFLSFFISSSLFVFWPIYLVHLSVDNLVVDGNGEVHFGSLF